MSSRDIAEVLNELFSENISHSSINNALFIVYGVRTDGFREVLGVEVMPSGSAYNWEELFINIKNRGVKNVGLIVADGINGLEEVIHLLFPKAKFQKCVVHKQRQILRKTRAKDKVEMASDLKYLFDNFGENATKEKAL